MLVGIRWLKFLRKVEFDNTLLTLIMYIMAECDYENYLMVAFFG